MKIPHIRFNLNEYEYVFFIPSGYSPRELNPRLSWTDQGNGFWLGRYRSWLWYQHGRDIIVYGLYLAGIAVGVVSSFRLLAARLSGSRNTDREAGRICG